MRHRACDCPNRRHLLIQVTLTIVLCVMVAMIAVRAGVAVGSADLVARTIATCKTD